MESGSVNEQKKNDFDYEYVSNHSNITACDSVVMRI